MKKKSNIHIKKSKQGTFTKAAKKRGMSVQAFARLVLANKDKYSSEMVKKANFAHNSTKWKHKDGGTVENKPVRAPKGYHWMKDKESYNLMAHKGDFVPHTNARQEVKFPVQTKHQLGGTTDSFFDVNDYSNHTSKNNKNVTIFDPTFKLPIKKKVNERYTFLPGKTKDGKYATIPITYDKDNNRRIIDVKGNENVLIEALQGAPDLYQYLDSTSQVKYKPYLQSKQSGGDISFPNANSYQQVGTMQYSNIPSTTIKREGRPTVVPPRNTLFRTGGDVMIGNTASTEEEYKNGLNDGINIFKFPRKGLKKMTMTPNSGNIEYPVEYKGYTDGKQTDQGIAQPGQDFNVNGDTVVEIPDLSDMEFNEAFDYANRNKLPIFKWKDNDYPIKKNKKYSKMQGVSNMQDGGLFSNKVTNNVKLDPGFKPDININ